MSDFRSFVWQEEFQAEYGPKFDQELEKLLWEFLLRLDRLLPVPNLAQVVGSSFDAGHVDEIKIGFAGQSSLLHPFFLRLCHG